MEIKELESFYINEASQTLEVTFRIYSDNDELVFNLGDRIFGDEDDIDDEEVEGLFDDLRESLDMFKRFTKYN